LIAAIVDKNRGKKSVGKRLQERIAWRKRGRALGCWLNETGVPTLAIDARTNPMSELVQAIRPELFCGASTCHATRFAQFDRRAPGLNRRGRHTTLK
jgi:hypothetical protein